MKRLAAALLLLSSCTGKETPGVLQAGSPMETLETGYRILDSQMESARMNAGSFHVTHYVVLEPGAIRHFRETSRNAELDPGDEPVGVPAPLPPDFVWIQGPQWIGITPSGPAVFPAGFSDSRIDIVAGVTGSRLRMSIDVDQRSAKLGNVNLSEE